MRMTFPFADMPRNTESFAVPRRMPVMSMTAVTGAPGLGLRGVALLGTAVFNLGRSPPVRALLDSVCPDPSNCAATIGKLPAETIFPAPIESGTVHSTKEGVLRVIGRGI